MENNRFMGHVVGGELVCRGHGGCRGCTSWNTRLSWRHVVGHMHVVEVCRGEQSFYGACRGWEGSTSWVRGVSWMHVVDTACRGITGREVLYTNGIDLLLSICFTDLIFIKYEFNLTSNKHQVTCT